MHALYFAYGSNLWLPRMQGRVPSAVARGSALLRGSRLVVDKHGRDGTAKANLLADPAASVWGVLYAIDPSHWSALDACEGGYARVEVRVETAGGVTIASTYVSELRSAALAPSPDYLRLLVDGAREHGLPADWVARLEALAAVGGGEVNAEDAPA